VFSVAQAVDAARTADIATTRQTLLLIRLSFGPDIRFRAPTAHVEGKFRTGSQKVCALSISAERCPDCSLFTIADTAALIWGFGNF
jgi:hypothetical protein